MCKTFGGLKKKPYLCTRLRLEAFPVNNGTAEERDTKVGKLSEWSKEPHSKCGVRITSYRGFESLTFRIEGKSKDFPSVRFYNVL